jgi:hypothetical protein
MTLNRSEWAPDRKEHAFKESNQDPYLNQMNKISIPTNAD